jgi:hypothetical protein
MTLVSQHLSERARKIESLILSRLIELGQVNVARESGLHESKVSKMKGEVIEEFSRLLAALGLRIVRHDRKCYRAEQLQALFVLAKFCVEDMGLHDLEDES